MVAKEPTARRRGTEWTKLTQQRVQMARSADEPCCMCGKAIDYTLNGNQPLGPTTEHVTPISAGGSIIVPLDQLMVAHRVCQNKQGGRIATAKRWGSRPKPQVYVRPEKARRTAGNSLADKGHAEPRLMSPSHPDAAGCLLPRWAEWLKSEHDFEFRPWQAQVLSRALETDKDGRLCWREAVISTPRQSGKSLMIWAINLARAHFSEQFSEPQECLHVANNLAAARRIHQRAWRWAETSDLKLYKAFGGERIIWPDGSHWSLVSTSAIWGWSASQAVVDEAWDVHPDVVDSALTPTLVERDQPMLWLMSTANEGCTSLMPAHRLTAMGGSKRIMIAEWGAPAGADIFDPDVWRAASPHWSDQRFELMEASVDTPGFRHQWLNMWPEVHAAAGWAQAWPLQPALKMPAAGQSVGAVEAAYDRSCYGVAIAKYVEGMPIVEAAVKETEKEAQDWLVKRMPSVLIAGASISERFLGPWALKKGTAAQTALATPWLTAALKTGLAHNHDPLVERQVSSAVVGMAESGPVLSARKSGGPIPAAKAIAWAAAAVSEDWYQLQTALAVW